MTIFFLTSENVVWEMLIFPAFAHILWSYTM